MHPASLLSRLSVAALACAALLPGCKVTDARQGAGTTRAAGAPGAPGAAGERGAATRAPASGGRAGMSAAATRALDSGNSLLRAKKDREALAQYRAAAATAPGHVAPWFGIGMAATRLGDGALADSARKIVAARSTNPGMRSLGATVPGHGAPSPHGGAGASARAGDRAPRPAPASPHGAAPLAPTEKGGTPW